MRVKYVGRFDAVDVPEAALVDVKHGEPVEVSAELGQRLIQQKDNWQLVKPPAKKRPAAKKAAAAPNTKSEES